MYAIISGDSSEKVLLHVFHYGEIHAAAIAMDYNIAVTPLRSQLERFERGGLLKAKSYGRLRVFSFNEKCEWTNPVLEILKIAYNSIPLEEKEKVFSGRRKPRLKGKPVLK